MIFFIPFMYFFCIFANAKRNGSVAQLDRATAF